MTLMRRIIMGDPTAHAYYGGFDDGHLSGEYANPYEKQSEPDEWLAYRSGFDAGLARFNAEESTPLNEQLALAEEDHVYDP